MSKDIWLAHHGIKGQKWGVRRFQDKSGRLTTAGKKRYNGKNHESEEHGEKEKFWTDERKAMAKKIAIGTAVVAGVALASYGTYKLYQDGKLNPIIDKFRKEGQNGVKGFDGTKTDFSDSGIVDIDKYYSKIQDSHNVIQDMSVCGSANTNQHDCAPGSIALLERQNNNRNIRAKDVPKSTDWEDVKKIYPGSKPKAIAGLLDNDTWDELSEHIAQRTKEGENGLIGFISNNSSQQPNHMMAYRKENGKLIFMDQQQSYGSLKGFEFSADGSICRLGGQNVPPTKAKAFLEAQVFKLYDIIQTQYLPYDGLQMTNDKSILDYYFEEVKDD